MFMCVNLLHFLNKNYWWKLKIWAAQNLQHKVLRLKALNELKLWKEWAIISAHSLVFEYLQNYKVFKLNFFETKMNVYTFFKSSTYSCVQHPIPQLSIFSIVDKFEVFKHKKSSVSLSYCSQKRQNFSSKILDKKRPKCAFRKQSVSLKQKETFNSWILTSIKT